jgi:hypothetical protein
MSTKRALAYLCLIACVRLSSAHTVSLNSATLSDKFPDSQTYPLMVYHAFRLSLPPYDVKPPDSIHIYTDYGNDHP